MIMTLSIRFREVQSQSDHLVLWSQILLLFYLAIPAGIGSRSDWRRLLSSCDGQSSVFSILSPVYLTARGTFHSIGYPCLLGSDREFRIREATHLVSIV